MQPPHYLKWYTYSWYLLNTLFTRRWFNKRLSGYLGWTVFIIFSPIFFFLIQKFEMFARLSFVHFSTIDFLLNVFQIRILNPKKGFLSREKLAHGWQVSLVWKFAILKVQKKQKHLVLPFHFVILISIGSIKVCTCKVRNVYQYFVVTIMVLVYSKILKMK